MTYLLFIIYLSKSDFDDISIEETWPFSDDTKSLFIGYFNADIKLIYNIYLYIYLYIYL